jgi:2-hydroxychromene-2-carboxylate isomerase
MRIAPLARNSWRHGQVPAVPAQADLQGVGWDTSPFNLYPAKGRYMWRDLERLCADLGLPFRQPEPFPQPSLLAARVALVGLTQRWGEDFCRAVFRAEFGEAGRIDDTATIVRLLTPFGVGRWRRRRQS